VIRVHHAVTLQVAGVEPSVTYALVAEIRTDSLDIAFATSQQFGSRPWTERPRVRAVVATPCRSTSLGDVLELRGELHIIRPAGFAPVESLAAAAAEVRAGVALASIVGPPKSAATERSRLSRPEPSAPGWIGQVLAVRARR
jgi:hypothetical protein